MTHALCVLCAAEPSPGVAKLLDERYVRAAADEVLEELEPEAPAGSRPWRLHRGSGLCLCPRHPWPTDP